MALNRTWLSLLLLVLFCSVGSASSQIRIHHLKGPIYVIEDGYWVKENSVFYLGPNSITVISASWTPKVAEEIVGEIRKISSIPIRYVVDTHFHPDRAGGNAYFKKIGAKILSTELTKRLLQKRWAQSVASCQKAWPAFPSIPLVLPDITFKKTLSLENGNIELIYFGPSHTPDDIVAYFPKEKVLYGDCVVKEKLGNLEDANLKEYPETLNKIKQLPISTLVAGHWSPIHGPELIDQELALLAALPKNRK